MANADAVAAIQAWTRLDQALTAFNRELDRNHGVTGAQLAILRRVHEWGPQVRLSELRSRLVMHPATLGQLVDRLAARDLVDLTADAIDRRRRLVELTDHGYKVMATAPLAGPVRLGEIEADPGRLRRLTRALTDAVDLFGLDGYVADRSGPVPHHE